MTRHLYKTAIGFACWLAAVAAIWWLAMPAWDRATAWLDAVK